MNLLERCDFGQRVAGRIVRTRLSYSPFAEAGEFRSDVYLAPSSAAPIYSETFHAYSSSQVKHHHDQLVARIASGFLRRRAAEFDELSPVDWVLVHSMGKVGSYSVYRTLKSMRRFRVLHTHHLQQQTMRALATPGRRPPGHITDSVEFLGLCRPEDRVKMIVNVREPMGRNVSAFFENLDRFDISADADQDIERVVDTFVQQYPHHVPEQWFDVHLKQPLGIDVLDERISETRSFEQGQFEVLLLRTEDPDEAWQADIRRFLEAPDFLLGRMNVGSDKTYAELYSRFKEAFRPGADMLDQLYEVDYVRAFYTADERAELRSRWER